MSNDHKVLSFGYLFFLAGMIMLSIAFKETDVRQHTDITNVPAKAEAKEADPTVLAREAKRSFELKEVTAFLTKYNAPLKDHAEDIVDASYVFGLDYRLLSSISMAESGGGKHTPSCAGYNPFGWSSTTSPCGFYRFKNFSEAIWTVAEKLGTNPAYARFQNDGQIYTLATIYNPGEADTYTQKLNYFINEFKGSDIK